MKIITRNNGWLPTQEDLTGAAMAIGRIQQTYRLPISSLAIDQVPSLPLTGTYVSTYVPTYNYYTHCLGAKSMNSCLPCKSA